MREMVDGGCGACVMEVSSHALALRPRRRHAVRRRRLHEPDARSSRLPRRHGGLLRRQAPAVRDAAGRTRRPSINVDDPRGASLVEAVARPVTYAINRTADVTPGPLSFSLDGLDFDVRTPQGDAARRVDAGRQAERLQHPRGGRRRRPRSVCRSTPSRQGLQKLAGVPGRFEVVSAPHDDITVVVDYAHTDDALRNLLETARPLASRRLITVFGAAAIAIGPSGR